MQPCDAAPGRYAAIVIGASAGGIQALKAVFEGCGGLSTPVLVTLHVASGLDVSRAFTGVAGMSFVEAYDKAPVRQGVVTLAPAGYHLLVEADRTLALSIDPPVNHSRPSIDVLFESAAEVYRRALIGVILTGASADGAAGLRAVKRYGGCAIVQDPATAAMPVMPQAALADGFAADHVVPLDQLGPLLGRLAREPAPASSRSEERARR